MECEGAFFISSLSITAVSSGYVLEKYTILTYLIHSLDVVTLSKFKVIAWNFRDTAQLSILI